MLSVEGATYEDALIKANNLLLTNLWGDGLPLWPATKERVDWILQGAALPRTHVLGKFPPRGGITTVETCAIALAMAGGRPEYLPVLVAAVEACLDRRGLRPAAGDLGRAVPGRHRQRADREADPPQFGLRPARPGSAASRGREHRARAAPAAAERRRRAAGRRHDGDLRRDALHQRGLRRGRGGPAAGLAAARAASATASRRARTRSRSSSRAASPTSGAAARRRRRRRRTR